MLLWIKKNGEIERFIFFFLKMGNSAMELPIYL